MKRVNNFDNLANEYNYIASRFAPKYVDILTYILINRAKQTLLEEAKESIVFEFVNKYKDTLDNQIYSLLIDCYILGRIEIGTQRKRFYFTEATDNDLDFVRKNKKVVDEFTMMVMSILNDTYFTKRSKPIEEMMTVFEQDAGNVLVEYIKYEEDNTKLLSTFIHKVSHVGREIALTERLFYKPELRKKIEPRAKKIAEKEYQSWLAGLKKIIDETK